MSEVELTTAQTLGRFYGELIGEGVPDGLAESIVRDASHQHLRDFNLTVSQVTKLGASEKFGGYQKFVDMGLMTAEAADCFWIQKINQDLVDDLRAFATDYVKKAMA